MKEVTALTRDPGMRFINEMTKTTQFCLMLGQVEDLTKIHQYYKDEGRTIIAIAGEPDGDTWWLYTTRSFIDRVDESGNKYSDLVDEYLDVRHLRVNIRVRMLVASTKEL
jgi:hypothetical protein